MKKFYLFILCLPFIAVCCTGNAKTSASLADQSSLINKLFVLESVNGESLAVDMEKVPELQFGVDMRVTGQVCNRFMGQGQFNDGTLIVPQMASTMMMCADEALNQLENDFFDMMRQGAEVTLVGDTLTVNGDKLRLVYTMAR